MLFYINYRLVLIINKYAEDVEYFKQVELRTKHGRRGNIKYHVGELKTSSNIMRNLVFLTGSLNQNQEILS